MKQQIICPKCFAKYMPQSRHLCCQNPTCESTGRRIPESSAVMENAQPHCPDCGRELSVSFCPRCGFEFSGYSADSEMIGISMVGAERCGKSNFLSVLLNSIKHEMARPYGCSLYPLGGDGTIDQYNRRYYQPLYEQGRCVSSTTQEDLEPLIYSLVFSQTGMAGRTASLTFYDACGANFNSVRAMEESNRNIYNSRGILFLIDPSQLPAIRERRRAENKTVCEVDPTEQLARMIHLIRGGRGQSDVRKKITIPLAVCITKLDLLRAQLDPASFVAYPSRQLKKPKFDQADFESCSLEVMSLMESWAGKDLINQITAQFSNYGFFAFSSLGEEPAEDNRVQHIRPHRVMDPFLWILCKNGIIDVNKK